MVGVDLSASMVAKLVEKAGGRAPFSLAFADATRLPFRHDAFGGALARHVLHLIPAWKSAVGELVRVVRPGGRLLVSPGYADKGPWQEVGDRLEGILGQQSKRVGFQADDAEELDSVVESLGGTLREVPTIWETSDLSIERYLQETGEGIYSWTWGVDADELRSALAETRDWATSRFGSLDQVLEPRFSMTWRLYDLS
jgi:ubiquinone/menaquinone biosynthesis C-methylase UbiE